MKFIISKDMNLSFDQDKHHKIYDEQICPLLSELKDDMLRLELVPPRLWAKAKKFFRLWPWPGVDTRSF